MGFGSATPGLYNIGVPGKAYLSILQWPDEMDDPARVEALVASAGLDPFLATQRVRRGTPLIAAIVDEEVRESVLAELRDRDVLAFAPSQGELSAVPPALRAKRLVRPEGAPKPMFLVEPWRGEPEGLLCENAFLIVRARLDQSTTRIITGSDAPAVSYGPGLGMGMGSGSFGVGMGLGMSMGDAGSPQVSTTHSHRHVLDLYTRDNRRIRCDSEKFNFDVLGDKRGLTDLENSRRLAELVESACRRASVDAAFQSFRASGDILTNFSRSCGDVLISRQDDSPAFEFYSAWSYCLHAAMRTG